MLRFSTFFKQVSLSKQQDFSSHQYYLSKII